MFRMSEIVNHLELTVPVIALVMGPEGVLSRALNTFMTPVTHENLPVGARQKLSISIMLFYNFFYIHFLCFGLYRHVCIDLYSLGGNSSSQHLGS